MKRKNGCRIFFEESFCGRDLAGADFSNCIIGHCQFNCANLARANFSGAWIWDTVFSGANLHSARFDRATIRKSIFLDAKNVPRLDYVQFLMDRETLEQFVGALKAAEGRDD